MDLKKEKYEITAVPNGEEKREQTDEGEFASNPTDESGCFDDAQKDERAQESDDCAQERSVESIIAQECSVEGIMLSARAYGKKIKVELSPDGLRTEELFVPKADILLVNAYACAKLIPIDLLFTVVYKCGDEKISDFEFVLDADDRDASSLDKLNEWAELMGRSVENNDWNDFNPIKNGYLTYRYVTPKAKEESTGKNQTYALGMLIAGVLVAGVSAVLMGLGRTTFGAIGLVLGILAAFIGGTGVFKKKK